MKEYARLEPHGAENVLEAITKWFDEHHAALAKEVKLRKCHSWVTKLFYDLRVEAEGDDREGMTLILLVCNMPAMLSHFLM